MTPAFTISVWLVFGTALPSNFAQTMTAVPYASFEACELGMVRAMSALVRDDEDQGPGHRPITIRPYCTTVPPAWWDRRYEARR